MNLTDFYNSTHPKYHTDKFNHKYLLPVYEKEIGHRKDEALTIIEIGIQHGNSLRIWAEYFPKAQVIGVDITKLTYFDNPRIHTIYEDVKKVQNFMYSEFDIVIDDGSHTFEDQAYVIKKFYPMLKKGGVMIVEDIQNRENIDDYRALGIPFEVVDDRRDRDCDDRCLIYRKC